VRADEILNEVLEANIAAVYERRRELPENLVSERGRHHLDALEVDDNDGFVCCGYFDSLAKLGTKNTTRQDWPELFGEPRVSRSLSARVDAVDARRSESVVLRVIRIVRN
jgi:hypothetical protein